MQKTALLHHSPLKTPALEQVLLYPVEFLVAGDLLPLGICRYGGASNTRVVTANL